MSDRLAERHVESLVVHINTELGVPANAQGHRFNPQTRRDEPVPGALQLGSASGAWCIFRLLAGGGGEKVFDYDTLRMCYTFLRGISWLLYQQKKGQGGACVAKTV